MCPSIMLSATYFSTPTSKMHYAFYTLIATEGGLCKSVFLRHAINVRVLHPRLAKDACNGVTQMVVITRYSGVVHTERDQYH